MKNRKSLRAHQLGFTLMELLVVMAILAILTSVIAGGFRISQMRGRDAERKSDLKQTGGALELYYNDYGRYPDSVPWGGEFTDGKTTYFRETPLDPGGGSYVYRVIDPGTNQMYQLFAYLENDQDKDISQNVVDDNRDCGGKICNFGISSTNTTPYED